MIFYTLLCLNLKNRIMIHNELRIGNYVTITPHDENNIILLDQNAFELLFTFKNYDRIKPIPLTEEWLLKFCFTKHITSDIYPTFALKNINVNDGIVYLIGVGFLNHIKSVHQLQNLYFALTGEELTIKQ